MRTTIKMDDLATIIASRENAFQRLEETYSVLEQLELEIAALKLSIQKQNADIAADKIILKIRT